LEHLAQNEKPAKERVENPLGMSYVWYCILGTLLFYLGAALIAYLCFLIPEVNTGS